ncbi:MAG: DUF5305 family protein [Ignavibacteriales bacterium]
MNKNNQKRSFLNRIKIFSLNKKFRLSILIFLPIAITAAICFLYITINNKFVDQKYDAYTYSHKASINYDVTVLPNNLYTQKSLTEGGIYITDLVNSINPRMKYEFNGNQSAEIKGKYSITALFQGFVKTDKGEKLLWDKKAVIQPEKNFNIKDKNVLLKSGCNVSLNTYNQLVKMAAEAYKFNCTSKLTIIWRIIVDAKTTKGDINDTLESTMEIPINEKYFEIGGNLNKDKKGQITSSRKVLAPYHNEKIMITCIGIVLGLIMLLFIIFLTTVSPEFDPIEKKTRKIFNNYADRLVAVCSDVLTDYKKIIDVASIEDLVRIADDLAKSILYKIGDKDEEVTYYFVLDQDTVYMLDIRKGFSNIINAYSNKANLTKDSELPVNESL